LKKLYRNFSVTEAHFFKFQYDHAEKFDRILMAPNLTSQIEGV
jgi:hypothetical protein